MDVVAEAAFATYENCNNITWLEFEYESQYLRFLQARFNKKK